MFYLQLLQTLPGDLTWRFDPETWPGDLTRRHDPETWPRDLTQRLDQETSYRDFTQRLHLETSPKDSPGVILFYRLYLETWPWRLDPETWPGDLTRRLDPETWPRDLTQRLDPETWPRDFIQRLHTETSPKDSPGVILLYNFLFTNLKPKIFQVCMKMWEKKNRFSEVLQDVPFLLSTFWICLVILLSFFRFSWKYHGKRRLAEILYLKNAQTDRVTRKTTIMYP